jgi:inorganic triphosphatase YgiF
VDQIEAIFDGDMGLRRGQDPMHDTRVAIRRLRSTIRVFGKLLDRSAAGHLDEELKWFAGLLGEVRDRVGDGLQLGIHVHAAEPVDLGATQSSSPVAFDRV